MRTKIGLVFDDGFRKSSEKTAALFEQYKLPAIFSVLADRSNFAPNIDVADFDLWNELQDRGHVIDPHGFTHVKLSEVPYERGVMELEKCVATFTEKLRGFDASRTVYNYAYNCSTPELNQWILPRFRALRQGGTGLISQEQLDSRVWHSTTFGPADPGEHLMKTLDEAKQKRPPAMMYSLHGIDGEAWGAIALDTLRRALDCITTDPAFEYWTIGR